MGLKWARERAEGGNMMNIRRSCQLRWYKKAAISGRWSTYIQAANEEEVRWMHMQDLIGVSRFADRYPGPYTVEILPLDFIPPDKIRNTRDAEGDTIQIERESNPARGHMQNQG
jgi:hypothetical protein